MNYTHLRYAYYETYTEHQYLPAVLANRTDPVDLRSEARVRARYFVNAARLVAGAVAARPVAVEGRVLTVFVAPEFFLRSSAGERDGSGHYDHTAVQLARKLIADSLRGDPQFEDWLVIPGTAVHSQPLGNNYVIFNDLYAVAQLSGPMGGGRREWHCIKQFFSDLDQLEFGLNARNYLPDVDVVYQQIVELGGVAIGIEICLDHRLGALKKTVLRAKPPRRVDLQLVCACGTDVEPPNVATRANGYVLRCNGNDVRLPAGNEYRVGRWPGNQITSNSHPPLTEIVDAGAVHRFDLSDSGQIRPAWSRAGIPVSDGVGYFDPVRF